MVSVPVNRNVSPVASDHCSNARLRRPISLEAVFGGNASVSTDHVISLLHWDHPLSSKFSFLPSKNDENDNFCLGKVSASATAKYGPVTIEIKKARAIPTVIIGRRHGSPDDDQSCFTT